MTFRKTVISEDGQYRYQLWREWGGGPTALWIMLNPSTADATVDDPTIRRCRSFSDREGCGSLVVVNLFAYRATDPDELSQVEDPVGKSNVDYIRRALRNTSGPVIAAWGAGFRKVRQPRIKVESLAASKKRKMMCLGFTAQGHPKHPLLVPGDQPFEEFADQWNMR